MESVYVKLVLLGCVFVKKHLQFTLRIKAVYGATYSSV